VTIRAVRAKPWSMNRTMQARKNQNTHPGELPLRVVETITRETFCNEHMFS
jgi:hypothetical protein